MCNPAYLDLPKHKTRKGEALILDHLKALKIAEDSTNLWQHETRYGEALILDHAPPLPQYPTNITQPRKQR